MNNEVIRNAGYETFINDIKIASIAYAGVPFPDINRGIAKIIYYLVPGDPGQIEIEKSYYNKMNNFERTYDIKLNNAYEWVFEGLIEDYEIDKNDSNMKAEVTIRLSGRLQYFVNGELIAESWL